MSVLPGDLHPATDPIVAGFGELVEAGPLALLNRVKDAPKRLLDEVQRFEPASLVGDQLGGPYRQLLDRADGFSASQLFAAADAELARARQRLLDTARPSRALEPLRAPVQELFARLDAFSAEALLAPLTDRVEQTIAQIIEASPVDEILGAINGVFDTVRDVLTFAQRVQTVADRVRQLFEAFVTSDQQFDAWRDDLLDKVPGAGNAQVVSALAGLTGALDGARHADMLAAFDAATASVIAELDGLDSGPRLSRIVSAYGRLVTRVAALPASPTKDAAQLALGRFNPTQPLHSAPLRVSGEVRSAIASARSALVAMAGEWTETTDGFAPLRNVDAAALRDLVSAELEPTLRPVRFLFTSLGNLAAPVAGVVETLSQVITTLTTRVDALVTGPGSLSAISGAVQDVVDALRNIDLGFLGRSLDEVLLTVRDRVRAIDPARLGEELDDAFEQALSVVSLATIIPAAEITQVDNAWQAVIDKLRGLDPGDLVENALQPIWDETVLPLLDAFDLTPVFAALIEFLESLNGELGSGLDQVNTAYQSLIALRPDGGASVSVGV
jgi:methyl-accepting chemotaxis protein